MKQPVRNIIKETHPDLLIEPLYTLLIDGTNLLKISMADPMINTNGEHIGGIFQFLLQVKILLNKKDWDYVYVFFDDDDSGILRYKIYNGYKANRDKHYAEHIEVSDYEKALNAKISQMQKYFYKKNTVISSEEEYKDNKEELEKENFNRERTSLLKYFNEVFIRWIMDSEGTEGDDLIAYYVLNKKKEEKIVIVSADGDLTQLIQNDVCIYNPRKKKFITENNYKEEYGIIHENVLIKKIFCGDTSDSISNISGLSEKKLMEIIPEIANKKITINDVKNRAKELIDERLKNKKKPLKVYENILNGISNKKYDGDFYEINYKLIDLHNPLLTENAEKEMKDTMYAVQDISGRSFKNLYKLILDDDIIELKDNNKFTSFFSTFKKLTEKEIKRFELN